MVLLSHNCRSPGVSVVAAESERQHTEMECEAENSSVHLPVSHQHEVITFVPHSKGRRGGVEEECNGSMVYHLGWLFAEEFCQLTDDEE